MRTAGQIELTRASGQGGACQLTQPVLSRSGPRGRWRARGRTMPRPDDIVSQKPGQPLLLGREQERSPFVSGLGPGQRAADKPLTQRLTRVAHGL